MKSTGIVRKLDALGRVVLPKELRDQLEIDLHDPMEVKIDGIYIHLQKYQARCIFCKQTGALVIRNGKHICTECISEIEESY